MIHHFCDNYLVGNTSVGAVNDAGLWCSPCKDGLIFVDANGRKWDFIRRHHSFLLFTLIDILGIFCLNIQRSFFSFRNLWARYIETN